MITLAATLAVCLVVPSPTPPPPTERRPVTDTYHGVSVVDDYRWLEDWNDPAVKAWSQSQNAHARAYLDALPDAGAVRARVEQIMTAPSVRHYSLRSAAGRLIAMRRESSRQQPILVAFDDAADLLEGRGFEPRILIDPAAMPDETGGRQGAATIDWYVPSPDGELIAVSISHAGSEAGDVRVIRTESGERVGEIVERVNGGTAGGSLAWAPDGKGFYYSRYPRAGERPEEDLAFFTQVYYHELGTDSANDRYETGKDFPRIAEIVLECDPGSGLVLASVQNGDGGEFIHTLRDPQTGEWTQFTRYTDRIVQAVIGPDRALYMVSRKDAPRGQLLRLPIAKGASPQLAAAELIVPEQDDTLVSEFFEATNLVVTPGLVFATYQLGGPSEVRAFTHDGSARAMPGMPAVASAGGITHLGGDRVLYCTASFIKPLTWWLAEPSPTGADQVASRIVEPISTTTTLNLEPYTVTREMAVSKDGTKVPVNIINRKDLALDGSHPCVLSGYGGYGVNIEPYFSADDVNLLEQGFVLAVANIRGGGEFGQAWHLAGNLKNKQNVFDDFAGACRHLIERKYTRPSRLAIEGGSNGGLLMGALLTQHPDLVAAVVSHVGIYDMLRVELSPNGAFNIPEFGTVKDEGLFSAMYAYSPYHRVKDGTAYPATLFLTGANDPRVDPMQSRKMTARLQAATAGVGSAGPVLLRTSSDTGHGAGTPLSEKISQVADVHSFLLTRLGVTFKSAKP